MQLMAFTDEQLTQISRLAQPTPIGPAACLERVTASRWCEIRAHPVAVRVLFRGSAPARSCTGRMKAGAMRPGGSGDTHLLIGAGRNAVESFGVGAQSPTTGRPGGFSTPRPHELSPTPASAWAGTVSPMLAQDQNKEYWNRRLDRAIICVWLGASESHGEETELTNEYRNKNH